MQHPTCNNVRIRSTSDAHKIFAGVQNGVLHMVTRRLDADERTALCSGCVYAWEERVPNSKLTGLGIERFTEGRRWSPSRLRDKFLFYFERYARPMNAPCQPGNPPARQPPRDWHPLIKQTYSVWVETQKGRRKWHLTAYFTQATVDHLGTIDDNPLVRDLVVPDGTFESTRVGKSRTSKFDHKNRSPASTVPPTYAPLPIPYQYKVLFGSGSPNMTPMLMHELHEPYGHSEQRPPLDDHLPSPMCPPMTYIHLGAGPDKPPPTSYVSSSYSSGSSVSQPRSIDPLGFHSRYPLNFSSVNNWPHNSSRTSTGSWDETQHLYYPVQRLQYHHDDEQWQQAVDLSPPSYVAPVAPVYGDNTYVLSPLSPS